MWRTLRSGRLERFGILHTELLSSVATTRPDGVLDGRAWENLAFIDAYFSNFIEEAIRKARAERA